MPVGNKDFNPQQRVIVEAANRQSDGLFGMWQDPAARVIYADNFFSGLAPWMVIPATTETGTLDNTKSTGGSQSIKLTTLASLNSTITLAKSFPLPPSRVGLEFLGMIPLFTNNWALDMILAYEFTSLGGASWMRIRLQNNTGVVQMFYGNTSTTVLALPNGQSISGSIPAPSNPYAQNLWLDLKITCDFSLHDDTVVGNRDKMIAAYLNKYQFDMSSVQPYGSTDVGLASLRAAVVWTTTDALAKTCWLDSFVITRDEP